MRLCVDNSTIDGRYPSVRAVPCQVTVSGSRVTLTPVAPLEANSEYVVVVKGVSSIRGNQLAEPFAWSFTTQYTPLYADPGSVWQELSWIVEDISMDIVCRYVRDVSYLVQKVTQRTDIDWSNPPLEVEQAVRFRAAYDLLVWIFSLTAAELSAETQIGQLRVRKPGPGAAERRLALSELQYKLQQWWNLAIIGAGEGAVRVSTLGGTGDPYPYSARWSEE